MNSSNQIKKFILDNLSRHRRDIIYAAIQRFGVSRQAVLKHMHTLINDKSRTQTFVRLSSNILPIEVNGRILRLNAGYSVHQIMTVLQDVGLTGLEFSAGVPATLGGMVYMNFGCWGKSISEFIKRVRIMDYSGNEFWLNQSELEFGYRTSIFHKKNWIILEVELECVHAKTDEIKMLVRDNISERLSKQPLRDSTFGSVFKNPDGFYAAKLLDDLGFRGKLYNNNMKFSEKHANFLVNLGKASFKDVDKLINDVKSVVLDKSGIALDLEVRMVY